MRQSRNSRRGFTAVELGVVIVVLAILVTVTMVQVDKRRQARLREESAQNLRTLRDANLFDLPWLVDSGGAGLRFGPHLSSTPGQLAPNLFDRPIILAISWKDAVEDFIESNNMTAFISPAHPDAERMRQRALTKPESALTDDSYWFLGYGVPNEETGLAFVEAYKKSVEDTGKPPAGTIHLESGIVFATPSGDVTRSTLLPLAESSNFVYISQDGEKLGEGIAFFPNRGDPSSKTLVNPGGSSGPMLRIPIFIERPGLQRGGSNVLWGDGTVEFIPYPGKWPMTEKFIKALESLDALKEKE